MKKEQASILFVDDELNYTRMMKEVLGWAGYSKVYIANSGKEAMALVKSSHIDLAILDIMMPGMDGFEVMKFLKKHDSNIELIVISGTAGLGTDYPLQAGNLGVKKFFPKPFNYDDVIAVVNRIIESKPASIYSQIDCYLAEYNQAYNYNVKISKRALNCLANYNWSANAYDLIYVIGKLVVTVSESIIRLKDIPSELRGVANSSTPQLKDVLADFERKYIQDVLCQTHGNQVKAAKILNVDRKTLWAKLKKLDITVEHQ